MRVYGDTFGPNDYSYAYVPAAGQIEREEALIVEVAHRIGASVDAVREKVMRFHEAERRAFMYGDYDYRGLL